MSEMKALVEAAESISNKRDASSLLTAAAASPKKRLRKSDMPREQLLLHNRQAASESRRRKKEMVEDLQRSVAFFSKSNASLKARNAELERQILLCKQRMLTGDVSGGHVESSAAVNAALFESGKSEVDEEQARAAHFAATQAMYKSMGFPPAAARQAATTFASTYTPNNIGLSLSTTSPPNSIPAKTITSPTLLLKKEEVNQDQAQAAHFAATQALYKSMGFPPKAAKEAAATLSHCHHGAPSMPPSAVSIPTVASMPTSTTAPQSISQASYLEALNKYALQQQAAAQAAANVAAAAMQAARMGPSNFHQGGSMHGYLSGMDNSQLNDLLKKLRQDK